MNSSKNQAGASVTITSAPYLEVGSKLEDVRQETEPIEQNVTFKTEESEQFGPAPYDQLRITKSSVKKEQSRVAQ